jgi:hypothetical protein
VISFCDSWENLAAFLFVASIPCSYILNCMHARVLANSTPQQTARKFSADALSWWQIYLQRGKASTFITVIIVSPAHIQHNSFTEGAISCIM